MDVRTGTETITQFDTLLADLNKSAGSLQFLCAELLEIMASQNATFITPAITRKQIELVSRMTEVTIHLKELDHQRIAWLAAIKMEEAYKYEEWLKKMNFLKHEAEESTIREILENEAQSQKALLAMINSMVSDIVKRADNNITVFTELKTKLDQQLAQIDSQLKRIDEVLAKMYSAFKATGLELAATIKANQHPTFHSDFYDIQLLHDSLQSLHESVEKGSMTPEQFIAALRVAHRDAVHPHVRNNMSEEEFSTMVEEKFGDFNEHYLPHLTGIGQAVATKANIMHTRAEMQHDSNRFDTAIKQNTEMKHKTHSSESKESLTQRTASIKESEASHAEAAARISKHDQTIKEIDAMLAGYEASRLYVNPEKVTDRKSLDSNKAEMIESASDIQKNAPESSASDEQPGAPISPGNASTEALESPKEISDDLLSQLEAMPEPQPNIADEQPGAATEASNENNIEASKPATEISDDTLAELAAMSEPSPDISQEQPGAPVESKRESPIQESESSITDATLEDLLKEMEETPSPPSPDIQPAAVADNSNPANKDKHSSEDKKQHDIVAPDQEQILRDRAKVQGREFRPIYVNKAHDQNQSRVAKEFSRIAGQEEKDESKVEANSSPRPGRR